MGVGGEKWKWERERERESSRGNGSGQSLLLLRSRGCVNFSLRFQRKLFSTEAAYYFP